MSSQLILVSQTAHLLAAKPVGLENSLNNLGTSHRAVCISFESKCERQDSSICHRYILVVHYFPLSRIPAAINTYPWTCLENKFYLCTSKPTKNPPWLNSFISFDSTKLKRSQLYCVRHSSCHIGYIITVPYILVFLMQPFSRQQNVSTCRQQNSPYPDILHHAAHRFESVMQ